jgi:hypothetical protein
VFRKNDKGELVSCIAGGYLQTKYKKGKKTYAKKRLYDRGYGLAVFISERDARNFLWHNFSGHIGEIWRVETGSAFKPKVRRADKCTINTLKRFLQIINDETDTYKWPGGTRLTEWIKPLIKIK